jgi:transcription elongation factor Elf1
VGKAPIGYEKEGSWIKKAEIFEPIISDIYVLRKQNSSYALIERRVNQKYSSTLVKPLTRDQIKRILTDPLYMGKSHFAGEFLDSPELAFVDAETFAEVQKIEEGKQTRKGDKKAIGYQNLVNKKGLYFTGKRLEERIALLCGKCGAPMVKNGTKPRMGGKYYVGNYLCSNCGVQETVPTNRQMSQFDVIDMYCLYCGTPDDFTVDVSTRESFAKFQCNVCHRSFTCNLPADRAMRKMRERLREKGMYKEPTIVKWKDSKQLDLQHFKLSLDDSE